jgi:polysaccharide deacetylase family protein (PEP-CTERM system associated)
MNKTISITVDVEEWFHTEWFDVDEIMNIHYNGKYPKTDLMENMERLLDLFGKKDVKATFFVLGETAEKYPGLLSNIEDHDHEIACHGYYHNKKYDNIEEFENDIKDFRSRIHRDAMGFRFPNFNYSMEKLKILKKLDFLYDSSIVPCRSIPGWYGEPDRPLEPFHMKMNGTKLLEVPIAVQASIRFPGGGGWYMRNLGYHWLKSVIKSTLKRCDISVIYLHPWEVSDNNPSLKGVPFHVFRKCGKKAMMSLERIIDNFTNHQFISIREYIEENDI